MNKRIEEMVIAAVDKSTWEDEWERDYVISTAKKGASVMEKIMLENAVKWLEENYQKYCAYNVSYCGLEFNEKGLIADFKDAMLGIQKPKCDFVFVNANEQKPHDMQRCICYDSYLNAYACYIYRANKNTWCDPFEENCVCRYDDGRVTEWTPAN